jgi:hypothetical protein
MSRKKAQKAQKYQLFAAPSAINPRMRLMETGASSFCGSCAWRPSNRRF